MTVKTCDFNRIDTKIRTEIRKYLGLKKGDNPPIVILKKSAQVPILRGDRHHYAKADGTPVSNTYAKKWPRSVHYVASSRIITAGEQWIEMMFPDAPMSV